MLHPQPLVTLPMTLLRRNMVSGACSVPLPGPDIATLLLASALRSPAGNQQI